MHWIEFLLLNILGKEGSVSLIGVARVKEWRRPMPPFFTSSGSLGFVISSATVCGCAVADALGSEGVV